MHAPTAYKARYEREQHRRQVLEGRIKAMQLEIDALKWRLLVAQSKPELTVEERGIFCEVCR